MFLDYQRLGLSIPTGHDNELRFNCVFCEDDRAHLYVNTNKKVFHCKKCGAKGKTNLVGSQLNAAHFVDSLKHERLREPIPLKLPPAYKDIITPAAARYLASRGIYESDVARHTIYCAAPNTIYFGRIIIPNNVYAGYCNYYVARAYTKLRWPRYINPVNPKTSLFLSPEGSREKTSNKWLQHWDTDELMLVEGPIDYIKASRHGPTVALLGKELPYNLAKQVVTMFSKVYVMLDQGLTESIAALKIKDLLAPHVEVDILQCPRKDPGDMSPEDFMEIFNG